MKMQKPKPAKKMETHELLDLLENNGILQEANRTFFHPLGLNLKLDESFSLVIETTEDEHGFLLNSINPLALKVFRNYSQEKYKKRQEIAGFIIQTQDMIRQAKLKTPVTTPATLKLDALLKETDNFAYEIKRRLMQKSKDYDAELFDFDSAALSYDMFNDFQKENFIDGATRAMMMNGIEKINSRLKEIRKIEKDQNKTYKER